MSTFKLAFLELKRFKGHPLRYAALVAIILMPLVYGGLYLWFSWDPYGSTGDMPVAVVNEDKGAEVDGKEINAGDQLSDQLKETDILGWNFVDRDEAAEGLEDGTYYIAMRIPEDFSSDLGSLAGEKPRQAQIEFQLNDANGYIAGLMAKTVELEIQKQVNTAVYVTAAKTIFSDLGELNEQMTEAADGASEIKDGITTAKDKTNELASGLAELRDGSRQVADGVGTMSDKVTPVVNVVVDNWGDLAQSVEDVNSGVAGHLDSAQTQLDELCAVIDTDHSTACQDVKQTLNDAQSVNSGLSGIQSEMDSLVSTGDMNQALSSLQELEDGANSVADGNAEAYNGATQLVDGLQQLEDAQTELADGLEDGAGKIPSNDPETDAQNADVIGNPTAIDETNLNPAHTYGRGLAPFFIAISLWVFGLIGYLLLRPANPRAMLGTMRSIPIAVGGWLSGAILGVISVVVLYATLQIGLGLDPTHPWLTIGFAMLGILVFSAITHLLKLAFGAAGSLLIVVFLMLQLTSAGGLFPAEVTPSFFQILHPYLPMTYVVEGLRVAVSGGEMARLYQAAIYLVLFGIGALMLSSLIVMRRRRMSMDQLKPPLTI